MTAPRPTASQPQALAQRHDLPALRARVAQLTELQPDSILAHIGNTPLVALPSDLPGVRLRGKLEHRNPSGSLKDRIVLYLVADALERGRLRPGGTLVEGSSGNTGISIALVGAVLGYPVRIFMPASVSVERCRLMRAFGAEVVLTPAELGTDGAIERARALSDDPRYCWLAPVNILAHYDTTGPEILRQRPEVDAFVAPSGTTGTLMGSAMRLKESNPGIQVVAVWPEEWIMGLRRPEGAKRPGIYDEGWIDHVCEVSDPDAKAATRALAARTGLLLGPSSGAAWLAARRFARDRGVRNVVVCLPDDGNRYLSTDTFEPKEDA